MPKLNVIPNSTLVLKNVFYEKHIEINPNQIEAMIMRFETRLKLINISSNKPLISKVSDTQINHNGQICVNYEMYVELDDHENVVNFDVMEKIEISNCISILFEGDVQFLSLATSALDIYLYENNIDDIGILYSKFYSNEQGLIKIEYYKPVK